MLSHPIHTHPHQVARPPRRCHGFAAAVGKAGALVAGVVFNLVSNQGKFWISAFCGLAGVLCTFVFTPDITALDLREGDRRWLAIVQVRVLALGFGGSAFGFGGVGFGRGAGPAVR